MGAPRLAGRFYRTTTMGILKRKQKPVTLTPEMIPTHIAIIMDGNGRWAKKRGLPRYAGHGYGAETFRRIANHCRELGVRYLTVYAFSADTGMHTQ